VLKQSQAAVEAAETYHDELVQTLNEEKEKVEIEKLMSPTLQLA